MCKGDMELKNMFGTDMEVACMQDFFLHCLNWVTDVSQFFPPANLNNSNQKPKLS